MLAVVKLQGHQYLVEEGDEILVDKIKGLKKGDELKDVEVLMCFDKDAKKVLVGKPNLKANVIFEVKDDLVKGDKIRVVKFKNKNRYMRVKGFRPKYSLLFVKKIIVDE